MQYFRPPDPYFVGDCMPFFLDGTFSLYYLQDENHHRGKNGLGGHQWALATTRDLVHWQHHGLVVPIDADWECSICTGSTFYHDGTFYAFYASRRSEFDEHLSVATSPDGIHFTKTQPNPFASPGPALRRDYRDPCVFHDADTGLFHMLVTAHRKDEALSRRGGFLEHLVSRDLRQWQVTEPFITPDLVGTPECSDYFHWNGWYYLIFSCWGIARYRMSRQPFGPWLRPAMDTFNGPMARVMKTAAFTGNRRIGVSFLPSLADPTDMDVEVFAGNAVFQEVLQRKDGTLESRFVPEMMPATGEPLSPQLAALTPGVSGDGRSIAVCSNGLGVAALHGMPHDYRVTLQVTPAPGAHAFGLCIRGSGNYAEGLELRCRPDARSVEVRHPTAGGIAVNGKHAILGVDGLDRPFELDVVLKDDILDVCVDHRRCMVNRCPTLTGDTLFFLAEGSEVHFDSVEIRPLSR